MLKGMSTELHRKPEPEELSGNSDCIIQRRGKHTYFIGEVAVSFGLSRGVWIMLLNAGVS